MYHKILSKKLQPRLNYRCISHRKMSGTYREKGKSALFSLDIKRLHSRRRLFQVSGKNGIFLKKENK